jgi:hypothetical protein
MAYVIIATQNFYGPEERESVVEGARPGALIFDTANEAENYIAKLELKTYYTSYNESGRPDYRVEPISNVPDHMLA